MTAQRKRNRVGDTAWEVEWLSFLFVDENGDSDPDRSTYSTAMFKTKEAADDFARKIYPESKSGSVAITPMQFMPYDEEDAYEMPYVGLWEATGDSDYFEGE